MQKIKKFIPVVLTLTPLLVAAKTAEEIIDIIGDSLNLIIPVLIVIAVVVFLAGVIKYITAGGDAEKRTEARNVMIYGIIGLFVMVAVWGLVNVLVSTFGLEEYEPPVKPKLPI